MRACSVPAHSLRLASACSNKERAMSRFSTSACRAKWARAQRWILSATAESCTHLRSARMPDSIMRHHLCARIRKDSAIGAKVAQWCV